MFRFFFIVYLLCKYSFYLLTHRHDRLHQPQLLRHFFEQAGGVFIKLGQMLSLRVDILPLAYTTELLNLFDNVPSFPFSDVEHIFQSELGSSPASIFSDFQTQPFASASFGQVHGAKLKDGQVVIVKVMRPHIESQVAADFLLIDLLAFIGDLFFKIKALPWKDVAADFKTWTSQELDYRIEAEHGDHLYRQNTPDSGVIFPRIYHHLTTRRILVEEYIDGIHLSRILHRIKDGRFTDQKLAELHIDLGKVARLIVHEIMREYFFFGFFHADPHPGNIILLSSGQIAFVDFGLVGDGTSLPHQNAFIQMVEAVGRFDYADSAFFGAQFAAEDLKSLIASVLPPQTDPAAIDQFMRVLTDHSVKALEALTHKNKSDLDNLKQDYLGYFFQLVAVANKFRVRLPRQFAVFARTISVIGILAKQLDPSFRLTDEIKKFFHQYPLPTFLKPENPGYLRRINREVAFERLHSWLSYLLEVDPDTYHIVNSQLAKYASVS